MALVDDLRARLAERELLLMTHLVVGYPNLDVSLELAHAMVDAGADLLELQIPFSEPIADGPVIARANQVALEQRVSVDDCLELAERVRRAHDVPVVLMTYYNILVKRGLSRFAADAARAGASGTIVPDCGLEESRPYVEAMRSAALAPIFLSSPRTPDARLHAIGHAGDGFSYVVARKGVTGTSTALSDDLARYIARCRAATELPLAVGFGLRAREDVEFLRGKADIAVVGSECLRALDEGGVSGARRFVAGLRS